MSARIAVLAGTHDEFRVWCKEQGKQIANQNETRDGYFYVDARERILGLALDDYVLLDGFLNRRDCSAIVQTVRICVNRKKVLDQERAS